MPRHKVDTQAVEMAFIARLAKQAGEQVRATKERIQRELEAQRRSVPSHLRDVVKV